jgi:hypothetical protein
LDKERNISKEAIASEKRIGWIKCVYCLPASSKFNHLAMTCMSIMYTHSSCEMNKLNPREFMDKYIKWTKSFFTTSTTIIFFRMKCSLECYHYHPLNSNFQYEQFFHRALCKFSSRMHCRALSNEKFSQWIKKCLREVKNSGIVWMMLKNFFS